MSDAVVYAAGRSPRLEQRLVLSRYFCRLFGVPDFHGLRELVCDQKEGVTEDSRTYVSRVLEGLFGLDGVTADEIVAWDAHILEYVSRLNTNRPAKVELKYFQYLAVLLSEIYLDRYFNKRAELLASLNAYVDELNDALVGGTPAISPFAEEHLRKLAFWLATGSGKTLLMHVHLWQYLRYAGLPSDGSIILVTPDEGLSRQHLREFERSGISARRHDAEDDLLQGPASVLVIEVTKLTETKSGGGQRVEVASFGSGNLVFVDEGHRGASGEVWRGLRNSLGADGFTFEYSATLGQVVNGAAKAARPDLLAEYGRSILVDYSYPHFHGDGYGKDYWVTNVADQADDATDLVLAGNLLSFFQQVAAYRRNPAAAAKFNLEPPLWIFVGHTVTAKSGLSAADKKSLSDVETIIGFLRRFLAEKATWVPILEQVLKEDTPLRDARRRDLFHGHFKPLRDWGKSASGLYDEIVGTVFHGRSGQELQAVELKAAPGEIGLRAGSGENPYFGVVNIGDVSGLRRLLEEAGVTTQDDVLTRSLFSELNHHGSSVSLLVGSRKFMEGWDSFRVSSMALMNIGRNEGSQVVQLFGRGVRLWGRNYSLQRSGIGGAHEAPLEVQLLETLNVFGVRADYMAEFRQHLEAEGIAVDVEEVAFPIEVDQHVVSYGLKTLELAGTARFKAEEVVRLRPSDVPGIDLDLRPRMERAGGGRDERERAEGQDVASRLRHLVPVIDVDRLYFDLLAFKQAKGFDNLVFSPADVTSYLRDGNYEVFAAPDLLADLNPAAYSRTHTLATMVLRKAAAALFESRRRVWEGKHLQLADLAPDDANLAFGEYVLRAAAADRQFISELQAAVTSSDIYAVDNGLVPSLVFERHLYQPLVLDDPAERVRGAKPPSLNSGESGFVTNLRAYVASGPSELDGRAIYLLRNLTQGKGIGLFEPAVGEAFYPDFLLWIVEGSEQRIAFIDPKGLRHARGGFSDPKVALFQRLATLSSELRQRKCTKALLTSFIVSTTKFADLAPVFGAGGHSQAEFEDEHVLFGEDPAVSSKMVKKLIALPLPA